LLPDDEVRDLWLVGDRVTLEPVPGARTLTRTGFILPGLVDAHCHLGIRLGGHPIETVAEARAAAPRTLMVEGAFEPAALADLPGLGALSVERTEDGVVRVTAPLHEGAPAQETLKAAFGRGLDIQRFELREPHLHDAFIVLTTREARP